MYGLIWLTVSCDLCLEQLLCAFNQQSGLRFPHRNRDRKHQHKSPLLQFPHQPQYHQIRPLLRHDLHLGPPLQIGQQKTMATMAMNSTVGKSDSEEAERNARRLKRSRICHKIGTISTTPLGPIAMKSTSTAMRESWKYANGKTSFMHIA